MYILLTSLHLPLLITHANNNTLSPLRYYNTPIHSALHQRGVKCETVRTPSSVNNRGAIGARGDGVLSNSTANDHT